MRRTPTSEGATPRRRVSVGSDLLGVDWSLENGAYRIARIVRGAPWDIEDRSPLDAPTGLMPEQKLVVPACPRRENGHLWRFDRERSTGGCQADVCQACGLVRLTSYRTGQVVRYVGSGADDDGA